MSTVKNSYSRKSRAQRNKAVRPHVSQTRRKLDEPHYDSPVSRGRNDPRQVVRDALDEEMRSRPTTMWQAFWDGFKRA